MRFLLLCAAAALACAQPQTIDNDYIRVEKTPRHKHDLNRVIVDLDSQRVTFAKAGAADPAGRLITIELKRPAPKTPPHGDPAMDPVLTDPQHNTVIFENDQVRVFRSWREPGASETMHEHTSAGRVAVFLTDVHATIKTPSGSIDKLDAPAGDFRWSGPVTHVSTNTGPRRFDMIIVEVK